MLHTSLMFSLWHMTKNVSDTRLFFCQGSWLLSALLLYHDSMIQIITFIPVEFISTFLLIYEGLSVDKVNFSSDEVLLYKQRSFNK